VGHRILFVEDQDDQIALLQDALEEWNRTNADHTFRLEFAKTYGDAIQKLDEQRFDGALIDLRLPGGGALPGQEIASLCTSTYGIPAAIISGNPADYDATTGHGMLAVFDKGDSDAYEKALSWFREQSHMMKVIGATRKNIQKHGAFVFSRQVWPRWKSYENIADIDDDQLAAIVSRQYASHIAEVLGIDSEENFRWHPFENYIYPPLAEAKANTGDIFKIDDKLWIIMTPQCDMAAEKAETVLLALCESQPNLEDWKASIADLQQDVSARRKEVARKFFDRLINQNEPAKHFLPPLVDGQPIMVNFKILSTVLLSDLKKQMEARIASVAAPFLPNISQRFGAYIGRIGQPNLDPDRFD
jgi:CheY-like chemotaxis protein